MKSKTRSQFLSIISFATLCLIQGCSDRTPLKGTSLNHKFDTIWALATGCINDHRKLDSYPVVAIDNIGNIYISGVACPGSNFGKFDAPMDKFGDVFIAKLDSKGNFLWVKTSNLNSLSIKEQGYGGGIRIKTDSQGNILIAGWFNRKIRFGSTTLSVNGVIDYPNQDAFVAKLDPQGNFLWAVSAGGPFNWSSDPRYCGEGARGIAIDNADNIIITGSYHREAHFSKITLKSSSMEALFIAKLDPAGHFIWAKSSAGGFIQNPVGISVDRSNMIYITGWSSSFRYDSLALKLPEPYCSYVFKVNPFGKGVWVRNIGIGMKNGPRGIEFDNNQNIIIYGSYSDQAKFGQTVLESKGWDDIFIAKIDLDGEIVWARSAGGMKMEDVNDVAIDVNGDIDIVGELDGPSRFGEHIQTKNISPMIFISTLDAAGQFTGIELAGDLEPPDFNLGALATSVSTSSNDNILVTGYFYNKLYLGSSTLTSKYSIIPYTSKLQFFIWKVRKSKL